MIRVKIFECPADTFRPGQASYVAIIGPTPWPGVKSAKTTDVKDLPFNTILVAEIHNSGIHWMEPRDLDMSTMAMTVNPTSGMGISSENAGSHKGGANVAFVNGDVHFLKSNTSPKTLRALLTAAGGEKVGKY
jgi:hypothetical protein